MRLVKFHISLFLFLPCFFAGCSKETIIISDNNPPIINNIPAIRIESYVNRVFIDLLGREPLDAELVNEVTALREADLAQTARINLISKLQNNTDFIEGDTSYQRAYYQQFYALAKARCLEGASDQEIDEVIGGLNDPLEEQKLAAVKNSRVELQNGVISIEEMFGRMINNAIYDDINMNAFNFVRASFDNLLLRYPTNFEFQSGFNMVENGFTEILFGETGSNREEYTDILIQSREMFEGLIIWTYQQLLARNPTTVETIALLEGFYTDKDLKFVQQTVMITDEYAGF